MIFKINLEDFLRKLFQEIPYLRYNETLFMLLNEDFYSKHGVEELPWKEPKNIIMHRSSADLNSPNPKQFNFEEDSESFINFCKRFFIDTTTLTFINLKQFLFVGTKKDLKVSEVMSWKALECVFSIVNLKSYLQMERKLIRIPCGNLNINLIQFPFSKSYCFCEITSLYEGPEEELSITKLQERLQLEQLAMDVMDKVYWTDLWTSHSNAVKS